MKASEQIQTQSIGIPAPQHTVCLCVWVGVEPLYGVYRIGWTFTRCIGEWYVNFYCTKFKAIHYELKRIHCIHCIHTHIVHNMLSHTSKCIHYTHTHIHTYPRIQYAPIHSQHNCLFGYNSNVKHRENTYNRHSRKFPTWMPIFNAFCCLNFIHI